MKIKDGYGLFLTGKRIEQGLTIKKLSEMTGVPIRNIENIERGDGKGWSLDNLTKYLKGLNIPLSDVLPEDGVIFECKRSGGDAL